MRGIALTLALFAAACSHATPPPRPPPADPLTTVTGAELFNNGMALAQRGDLIRGEQYLAMAVRRGHPEAQVIRPLIMVCVAASRLSAAVNYAEPYLERHPRDWRLRYLVATLLDALGEQERARIQLERVVELNDRYAEAHFLLAELTRSPAEAERARAHYQRYLELDPQGTHADEVRARLLRSTTQ